MISCRSLKDWIPPPRIPFSLLWRAVSFAEIFWHPSIAAFSLYGPSSQGFLGRVLSAQEFFFLWWSQWLRCWFFYTAWSDLDVYSFWSSLRGLAVLHYILLKNHWVDSEVGFRLHFLFRLCVSRGFTKDLGWLSCLRSPTFRHWMIYVIRVSQDIVSRLWRTLPRRINLFSNLFD